MIIEIAFAIFASLVGGAIGGALTVSSWYKRGYIGKAVGVVKKELAIPSPELSSVCEVSTATPNADGLIVQDAVEKVITVEEHFEMLKKQYSKAYDEYEVSATRRNTRVHQNASRRVMKNILAYEAGEMTIVIGRHTMDFSNGDEVWIGNRYHSFGNVWECKEPNIEFDSDSFRLDPYVWLRLVDLEVKITENDSWKPRTVRVKS